MPDRWPLREYDRIPVELGAALASRDDDAVRNVLEKAVEAGAATRIEEVLIQSYLFLGYPAALNGLALWRRISGEESPSPVPDDPDTWRSRGEKVCRVVYGDQYEALRENVRALHPDMERWMIVEGYGKVLGRDGLDLRVRELSIAALLAVLNLPVQLYSHLRGALNAGATHREVEAALDVASGYMSDEARRTADAAWTRIRDRKRA